MYVNWVRGVHAIYISGLKGIWDGLTDCIENNAIGVDVPVGRKIRDVVDKVPGETSRRHVLLGKEKRDDVDDGKRFSNSSSFRQSGTYLHFSYDVLIRVLSYTLNVRHQPLEVTLISNNISGQHEVGGKDC